MSIVSRDKPDSSVLRQLASVATAERPACSAAARRNERFNQEGDGVTPAATIRLTPLLPLRILLSITPSGVRGRKVLLHAMSSIHS
ncbi:hypothetical protein E2C01_096057 [Portunus trituberculatus]|uniref:Uncharacterized protein n=1 Tax=Portunus trituberculatus TaxID=210409 RepID=A0A5B7K792_PORTR|nr:hypothetical protein [Portunus trituberculatus]